MLLHNFLLKKEAALLPKQQAFYLKKATGSSPTLPTRLWKSQPFLHHQILVPAEDYLWSNNCAKIA